MPRRERRRARRLPVHVPVEVDTKNGPVEAAMRDLSRPGVRLHLKAADLGFAPTADVGYAAFCVGRALRETVSMRLHYQAIGPLVEKCARVTRIAVPIEAPEAVEIGCHFDTPLSAEQVSMLGVALPPAGDGSPVSPGSPGHVVSVYPPQPALPPRAPAPAGPVPGAWDERSYRALISSVGPGTAPSILCQADRLNAEAVRVRMSRRGYEDLSVTEAAIRITQRHGSELSLKLMEGTDTRWIGPVRLYGVEVPAESEAEVLLTFAFAEPLGGDDRQRLGLKAA
jgi:hypothetical protein